MNEDQTKVDVAVLTQRIDHIDHALTQVLSIQSDMRDAIVTLNSNQIEQQRLQKQMVEVQRGMSNQESRLSTAEYQLSEYRGIKETVSNHKLLFRGLVVLATAFTVETIGFLYIVLQNGLL